MRRGKVEPSQLLDRAWSGHFDPSKIQSAHFEVEWPEGLMKVVGIALVGGGCGGETTNGHPVVLRLAEHGPHRVRINQGEDLLRQARKLLSGT